jgi:hypothetical protein
MSGAGPATEVDNVARVLEEVRGVEPGEPMDAL